MSTDFRGLHDDPKAVAPTYQDRVLGAEYQASRYQVYATVEDVRSAIVAQSDVIFVPGVNQFKWSPTSTATDDGVLALQITGVETGRYLSTGAHQVIAQCYQSCAEVRLDPTYPLCICVSTRGTFRWTTETGTDSGDELTPYIAKVGGGYSFEDRAYADFTALEVAPPYEAGRAFYANNSLNVMTDFSDVTIQIGEELQTLAVNDTFATVTNGTPVYASGGQGQRVAVQPLVTGEGMSDFVIGMLTHNVEEHQNCRVTTYGLVRDLDTSSLTAGDKIYTDGTASTWTNTVPTGTVDGVYLGIVLNSHPTSGIVFLDPAPMPQLGGTTAARPASPRLGRTYWNTDISDLEVWTGSTWTLA